MYSIKFLKYHKTILERDFNAKVGWIDIFESTIRNRVYMKIMIMMMMMMMIIIIKMELEY
jgi:hypothetical protein